MTNAFQEAITAAKKGALERSERLFRAALQQDPDRKLEIMDHLVDLSLSRDDFHSATRWLKRMIQYSQDVKDLRMESQVSLRIAQVILLKEDYEAALAWVDKAFSLAERQWSRQHMAEALMARSRLLGHMSAEEEAIVMLRRARSIWEEISDEVGIFRATLQLGRLFYRTEQLSLAEKEFRRSLQVLHADEVLLAAELHLKLAKMMHLLKRDKEGIPHALAALGRYQQMGSISEKKEKNKNPTSAERQRQEQMLAWGWSDLSEGEQNALYALGLFRHILGVEFEHELTQLMDPETKTRVSTLLEERFQDFSLVGRSARPEMMGKEQRTLNKDLSGSFYNDEQPEHTLKLSTKRRTKEIKRAANDFLKQESPKANVEENIIPTQGWQFSDQETQQDSISEETKVSERQNLDQSKNQEAQVHDKDTENLSQHKDPKQSLEPPKQPSEDLVLDLDALAPEAHQEAEQPEAQQWTEASYINKSKPQSKEIVLIIAGSFCAFYLIVVLLELFV